MKLLIRRQARKVLKLESYSNLLQNDYLDAIKTRKLKCIYNEDSLSWQKFKQSIQWERD